MTSSPDPRLDEIEARIEEDSGYHADRLPCLDTCEANGCCRTDRRYLLTQVRALRASLEEMVTAMQDYEMATDESPPYKHRAMMERANTLLGREG